jgi:Fe2+ transport system protein FeoA
MGLVEGERVSMLRAAPFGGPYQVRVGTAAFALDRALAGLVAIRDE